MLSTMMDVPLTVTALMRHGTTVYGDSEVATYTGDGVRRQSFTQTGARAARLASALRELGVTGDQRVGTLLWNNEYHLEAYLAVPSMGAVLHTLNLRLDPAQIGYIANHAEDYVIITEPTLAPLLAQVLPHLKTVRHILVTGSPEGPETPPADTLVGAGHEVHLYEELLSAGQEEFSWPEVDERTAAATCYTSGTTGMPKGVVYSHRLTYLHSMGVCLGNVFGLNDRDRVLPVVPMFHAMAWGLAYASVLSGADLIMPGRFLHPEHLARLIEAERPTIAGAVPTIWNGLLQYVREHGGDLSSLRLVPCGGSAVPHALMQAYQDEFGVTILQAWGMTETSPLGSVARAPRGLSDAESWRYRDTAGLFCTVEGRLSGPGGEILPHDGQAVGEVEVRGPWITGSYYKDDDPAKFHDGWLRTGDVGTIDRLGYVTLTDRAKDVIKSGGEWISSMELENILMAHPDVSEAAVIGVPDEKWGERPLAAVVVQPGATITPEELRAFLAERVPRWQVPERWAFIDEVPKTSVGKFAKTRMRDAYAHGDYKVTEVH